MIQIRDGSQECGQEDKTMKAPGGGRRCCERLQQGDSSLALTKTTFAGLCEVTAIEPTGLGNQLAP